MNQEVEFVAQIIHAYKHPLGTGKICGDCRELASAIVRYLRHEDN